MRIHIHICIDTHLDMGWLRLVGSLKLYVSFAKEPYKRDFVLQKRPVILRSLPIVATLYVLICEHMCMSCACVFIYMFIYICAYDMRMDICMCIYFHTCIRTCTHTYVCIYTRLHIYMMYVHISTSRYVHIPTCIFPKTSCFWMSNKYFAIRTNTTVTRCTVLPAM